MFTLLIADDEKLEREALKYIIRRGTEVVGNIIEAANGREAIEIAEREKPDIAFLDIKMPGINGVEAARRLKELLPACKIVFLTAFDTFDYAREALRLGAEDFLVKPVEDERVLELLDILSCRLQEESQEKRMLDRTRETLSGMIASRETELSEQLATGFLDTRRLADFITLLGIDSPRMELAVLKLDLGTYPMRVDREKHSNVLLTRCEQLLRREAEKAGFHCIPGRLDSEILMLLIGAAESQSLLSPETGERLERAVLEHASLRGSLSIEGGIRDFCDLERKLIRRIAGDDGITEHSVLSIQETLLQHIETGDEAELNHDVGMVFRWFYSWSASDAALERLDEVLAVLRHELARRFPGLKLPPCARRVMREIPEGERENALREMLRCLLEVVRQQTGSEHPAVRLAADVMRRRFREDLSVEAIAEEAGQSPSHLSRLFRQELGMSILDFLTRRRMDEAKRLLLGDPDRNIGQIAEAAGYRDPNYFSRVFRRETGLSPREYRLSGKIG
jgi:two-component system response regulator YesN